MSEGTVRQLAEAAERDAAENRASKKSDSLAAQKAEADRIAAQKAEADRVAAQKAEADRVAAQKAEADRIAAHEAEADRVAAAQQKTGQELTVEYHYVDLGGSAAGPLSLEVLTERIAAKELSGDVLVWKEGMADWAAASTLADIQQLLLLQPGERQPTDGSPPPAAVGLATEKASAGARSAEDELFIARNRAELELMLSQRGALEAVAGVSCALVKHERILVTLTRKECECPSLWFMYPKKRTFKDLFGQPLNFLLQNTWMLVVICPETLRMVECGPDGLGWEVGEPKDFVKKWGPAILMGVRVLSAALAVGRVVGIPLPTLPPVGSLGVSAEISLFDGYSDKLAKLALQAVEDMVSGLTADSALEAVSGALEDSLDAELSDSPVGQPPSRLAFTDSAYKAIHSYITTGPNACILEDHLRGRMHREFADDGTVEWVSVQGVALWKQKHSKRNMLPAPPDAVSVSLSASFDAGVLGPAPQTGPMLSAESSMRSWLRHCLVEQRHVSESSADLALRLFSKHDITTKDSLGSLEDDEVKELLSDADFKLPMGLKKHIRIIHAEAAKEWASPSASHKAAAPQDVASADEVAALRATLEAHALEHDRTKKELAEMKKKTANLKEGKPPSGGGGRGGLVQVGDRDEADADAIRGAVIEDVFRDPRWIQTSTQVQHLADAQPEEERRRAAAHAEDKTELFGKGAK